MVDLDELIERMEERYYKRSGDLSINDVDYDINDLSDEQRFALFEALKGWCKKFCGE